MADEPLFNSREFYVTNGTIGPVLWCPECREPIGYPSERVALGTLLDFAETHIAEHG